MWGWLETIDKGAGYVLGGRPSMVAADLVANPTGAAELLAHGTAEAYSDAAGAVNRTAATVLGTPNATWSGLFGEFMNDPVEAGKIFKDAYSEEAERLYGSGGIWNLFRWIGTAWGLLALGGAVVLTWPFWVSLMSKGK